MIRSLKHRDDVYVIGLPAPAEAGAAPQFIEFARERAGQRILDIGCGYGAYMMELEKLGHETEGVDPDPEYAKVAQEQGLKVQACGGDDTGYPDNSFDTVIMFEVLEHVDDPEAIVAEAARVARKNILITVPNNTELEELAGLGLTYWHIRTDDHMNFYERQSLEELCATVSDTYEVRFREPLHPELAVPKIARVLNRPLRMAGILKPRFFNRLYAEITLQ